MYKKWAINLKMKVKIIDEQKDPDYQDGYRNITLKIDGKYAYGWAKIDAGTHRLVRISPFDPQHKRHTSFAQVLVYPDIQIMNNNEINNSDLRIDTFRSSGAGGQSVNKTDSAIRITHIPTGIVVSCQNERSQHQNKSVALSILRSKLLQLDKENKKKQISESTQGKGQAVWGNQIRSVVLQPYKVVKDNRTEFETANVDEYLNGGDSLKEAMLLALEKENEQKE
jgi:peptide chain release factor 2